MLPFVSEEKLMPEFRSSVCQLGSSEDISNMETIQHNSNGIARIVVGGNDSSLSDQNSNSVKSSIDKTPRQNGDGAATTPEAIYSTVSKTSTDESQSGNTKPAEVMDEIDREVIYENSGNNRNMHDGIYDNLTPVELKKEIEAEQAPVTQSSSDEVKVSAQMNHKTNTAGLQAGAETASTDSEDYEIVLTSLTKLTNKEPKKTGVWPVKAERRYPHQIQAANALLAEKQGHSSPLATPVFQRSSAAAGYQIVQTNNEVRASMRRKGQYQSIAEYEKITSQASQPDEVKRHSLAVPTSSPRPPNSPVLRTSHCESQRTLELPNAANGDSTDFRSRSSINLTNRIYSPSNSLSRSAMNNGSLQRNALQHSLPVTTPSLLSASTQHLRNNSLKGDQSLSMIVDEVPQVIMRKKTSPPQTQSKRRDSLPLSTRSTPHNTEIRRVNSGTPDPKYDARKSAAMGPRQSHSFDRNLKFSALPGEDLGRSSRLHVVSSTNLIAPDNIQKSTRKSRGQFHSEVDVGKNFPVPVLDGKRRHSKPVAGQPVKMTTHLQWTPIHPSKSGFNALPNSHEINFNRMQNDRDSQHRVGLEQNYGFKRFFESILTYGPNSNKNGDKLNQPDVVLDSINHDQSKVTVKDADESDTESSIKSSASAYWPPELKSQACHEEAEVEEVGSWKFHVPGMKLRRKQAGVV